MREIELKAHVSDPEAVRRCLSGFMEFQGDFDKRDEYWSVGLAAKASSGRQFSFRLRSEPERNTVTYKEKTYRDRMEVNEEIEFVLGDRESFLAFLSKMGARPLYSKRKKGSLWRGKDGLQAELVQVEGLGYFLEVEIMMEQSPGWALEEIREKLTEVLRRCGLDERSIEGRPYSQLLGQQAT
jgi:predicted adenylyl cyclase CyaB